MDNIFSSLKEELCAYLSNKGQILDRRKRTTGVLLPFFAFAATFTGLSLLRCFFVPALTCRSLVEIAVSISVVMILFGWSLILSSLRIFPWFIEGTRDVYCAVDWKGIIQEIVGTGIKCVWLPVRWELRYLGTIKRHVQEIALEDVMVQSPEGVAIPVKVELKIHWLFNPLKADEGFRYLLLKKRDWSMLGESFEGPVRTRLQNELTNRPLDDVIATYIRLIGIIAEAIDASFQSKGVQVLSELTTIKLRIPEPIESAYILKAKAKAQSQAALQMSLSTIETAREYDLPPTELGVLKVITDGGLYVIGPQGQQYKMLPNIAETNRPPAQGRIIDEDDVPPIRPRRGGPRLPGSS